MTACPPDDQLRQLLAGQLPDEAADALTRHTDQCAACQRRLEQLSEDPTASRWRVLLRPAGDDTRQFDVSQQAATRIAPPSAEGDVPRFPVRRPVAPPPAPPGYEILGELGRGGMGVVYKARQTALKRLVALKVIVSGVWAGPDEVARFRAEAEAVAQLQHPNIVQIYEVGEHEGRPFFSLEYVEGGTLDRRLDGKPLAPQAAAELARSLALAIDAAHQRGVVHRDLKPANILLAACGVALAASGMGPIPDAASATPQAALVPKIADFGLAKRVGAESGLTHTGMIMGTPSYMAPEQAQGEVHDVGPAADTYALGSILYECLTGRPPFNAATALQTLQQVQFQTPVAPSRLQPAVPRDLETICLKCLNKEPPKRYLSALALAEDLERFLTGRPILARPASAPERAWKWAKRRPAVAALLGALGAAVVLTIVVLLWSVVRVSREAAEAKKQSQIAQDVVEDMYSNVAMDWLADDPDKNFLQRKFLGRALDYYKGLAAEDAGEPAARRRTARAYFRMGELHRMLNRPAQAVADYQEAIDRQVRLRDQYPGEPLYREDLAESYNWRGEVLREDPKSLEPAEHDFRTALGLQDELAREYPREPKYRRELARSHSNLGLVEMDTERPADARGDYDRAVALLDELVNEHAGETDFRHELARTLTNRGVFHHENGRLPQAEDDFGRAIDLLQILRRTGIARTTYAYNLAIAYQDMGNLRISQRRCADALVPLRQAETTLGRLAEDFPDRARYRKKLAKTYLSLGSALAGIDKKEEAEDNWQKGRDLLAELLRDEQAEAEYQADLGRCLGNLGWLRLKREDPTGARPLLEAAVGHLAAAHEANPGRFDYRRDLRSHYQSLAEALVQAGDRPAAVKAATALAAVFPDRARGYYYAACFVARCARLAEAEGSADDAARHAGQAAALLRQALDKGLTGDERLADEEGLLRPLAERSEFGDLLKELKALPRTIPAGTGT